MRRICVVPGPWCCVCRPVCVVPGPWCCLQTCMCCAWSVVLSADLYVLCLVSGVVCRPVCVVPGQWCCLQTCMCCAWSMVLSADLYVLCMDLHKYTSVKVCHESGKTSVLAVRCCCFVTNNNGHPSLTHTCMRSHSNHTRHALTHAIWLIHSRTRSLSRNIICMSQP